MKKFIIVLAMVFTGLGLSAQPPQGGRGGGPGGGRPPMSQDDDFSERKIWLENFPEIPELTLQQREKVGSILTDEQKEINKQFDKKRSLQEGNKEHADLSEKEKEKIHKEMLKIDEKISTTKIKSDNKVKKILSDNQYKVYLEKRNEFRFKREEPQKNSFPKNRASRHEGGDDNMSPPDFDMQ